MKVIKANNFKPSITDYPKKNIIYKPKSNLKRITRNTSISTNIKINVSIGDNVTHEKFGLGQVINIEGNGNDTKATVKFKKFGEKNLLLRFAKLNKV